VGVLAAWTTAHDLVNKEFRVGAYPPTPGTGWLGEAFLGLPDDIAERLSRAEDWSGERTPDFTFRTDWIDFPAGPVESRRDTDIATVGAFLDDYIYDVSDPSKLDEPFGHLFLRFSGFVKVRVEDEVRIPIPVGPPIWADFGTMGFDAYRLAVQRTTYRVETVEFANPWNHFGPSLEVPGLFRIEFTYLNRYDATGLLGTPRAGVELYSFHGSDKHWQAGFQMYHPTLGFGTICPPRVIYQAEDIQAVLEGDFEADSDLDLKDFQWLQICSDPSFVVLPSGCGAFDYDLDRAISAQDIGAFIDDLTGPAAAGE